MADITITITADEDDLRAFTGPMHEVLFSQAEHRLRLVVHDALPKPRIVVKQGMVLREHRTGRLWFMFDAVTNAHPYVRMVAIDGTSGPAQPRFDPDEWTVILDAEDA